MAIPNVGLVVISRTLGKTCGATCLEKTCQGLTEIDLAVALDFHIV